MDSDDAGASGLSILVVETDPAARIALLDHLRRRGFSVLESGHGGASIRAAYDRPFDYVVTDIDWSGVSDGSALARWVTANRPQTRVILTSKTLTHWFPADSTMASLPILRKPFRQEDLDRFLSPVAVMEMPGS
ncbi:response regulator [Reyranella sp.]|uniref:response regulator n=1 Tax=Reyranella sp. TaxID=1929291 RepID=UPI003BA84A09